VKIWELDTGKVVKELVSSSSKQSIGCVDYNPSTLTLGFGSADKSVSYWDLETFQ
jgi:WD40 repeat protein